MLLCTAHSFHLLFQLLGVKTADASDLWPSLGIALRDEEGLITQGHFLVLIQ
jgi:hypothetical protein